MSLRRNPIRRQGNDRLSRVVGASLAASGILGTRFRDEIVSLIVARVGKVSLPQLIREIRAAVYRIAPTYAQAVYDASIASWALGAMELVERVPRSVEPILSSIEPMSRFRPVTVSDLTLSKDEGWALQAIKTPGHVIEITQGDEPEPEGEVDSPVIVFPGMVEGINRLIEKQVVTRATFDAMTVQAKQAAFTVAYLDQTSTIDKIKEAVLDGVSQGTTLSVFAEKVEQAVGSTKLAPHHVENVFRTNVQKAYSEGQERTVAENPVLAQVFPYAGIRPIHDGRVRDNHLIMETMGLDGTHVYRSDDPVWQWLTPPISYNCRCKKIFYTIRQAARHGVKEAQDWLVSGVPPTAPTYRAADCEQYRPKNGFVSPGAK